MTTNTDAAREAAAKALNTARLTKAEELRMEVPCFWLDPFESLNRDCKELQRVSANAAIDAFLSKVLEGADEKLAEIRERNKALGGHFPRNTLSTMHLWANELYADNTALLTLVTAMSAKLKEVEEKANAMGTDFLALIESGDERERALQSQLAAQKAAHSKLLRDEADSWPEYIADPHQRLRRLAGKIEGGE